MTLKENEIMQPNTTYQVPDELVGGYFMFSAMPNSKEEARFSFWRCYFGWFRLPEGSVHITNGIAIYYGEKEPNIYNIISTAHFDDEQFHSEGITVLDNIVCKIKVMRRIERIQKYYGDAVVEIHDQFIFSINDHVYWGGFVKDYSHKRITRPESNSAGIFFSIYDSASQKEYVFGKNDGDIYTDSIFTTRHDRSPIKYFLDWKSGDYFFIIDLPKEISLPHISISWVHPNSHSKRCTPLTYDIEEKYRSELLEIEDILTKYTRLGFELEIKKELGKFIRNPDLILPCTVFLRDQLEQHSIFSQKILSAVDKITFPVSASRRDKKYYVASKLADVAVDVQVDNDNSVYFVTFDGTQIEEIDLMYHNIIMTTKERDYSESHHPVRIVSRQFSANPTRINADNIFGFLKNNLFHFSLEMEIHKFMERLSIEGNKSTLSIIVKSINNDRRRRLDKLYNEMLNESRVKVKWVNEYTLFNLVKKYVSDAKYQYQEDWLGQQSLDVFLPSQNIAIEYQGKQHYEVVDHFGGEQAFERTIERDERKRRLCFEHGVVLLEWAYTLAVEENNVLTFLEENNIRLIPKKDNDNGVPKLSFEMAPVLAAKLPAPKKKKAERKTLPIPKKVEVASQYVIKQYSLDGNFIADYLSFSEAAQSTAVSTHQIRSATAGRTKTAGGFQWRKMLVSDPNNHYFPIEAIVREISSNEAKAIYQMSANGEVVAEYKSIKEASRVVGVSSKSIRNVLSGTQKTAAGFLWTSKTEAERE